MYFKCESDAAQELHGELMSYDKMVFLQVVWSGGRHVIVSMRGFFPLKLEIQTDMSELMVFEITWMNT